MRERYGPAGEALRFLRGDAGTLFGLRNTADTVSRPSTHTWLHEDDRLYNNVLPLMMMSLSFVF